MDNYQKFIAASRYARWDDTKGRRETWEETVSRYVNFFLDKNKIDKKTAAELKDAIVNLEVMPSMRCLMTAGEALDRDNVAAFNCSYLPIDNPKSFDEMMYILMCFHPDTLVRTKTGNKRISELTITDEVLSYDEEEKRYEYINPSLVTETPSSNKEKVELQFEDGTTIKCTSDHKFLTRNRGWIEAQDLTEDDDIQNFHENNETEN